VREYSPVRKSWKSGNGHCYNPPEQQSAGWAYWQFYCTKHPALQMLLAVEAGDKGTWPTSFQWSVGTGQGEMAINLSIGISSPICEGTSSEWGWRSTGTGCPGSLRIVLLWRYSRPAWTSPCAACCWEPALQGMDTLSWTQWFLEVPSKPYNSVILWFYESKEQLKWSLY